MRSQLTGGLSVIFTRLTIAGEAKIRPHEIPDLETCRKVLGLDANFLYLHPIAQVISIGIKKRSITDLIPAQSMAFKPTNG